MAKGESYEEFVKKFKPKRSTDEYYTPPNTYAVVRDWVCKTYGVDPANIVRPFYPGGDYEHYNYPAGAVVVDNPPFSILAKICEFYLERGIPFFLFAPTVTCFSGRAIFTQLNHIVCGGRITYENGARVRTSFITNLGDGTIVAQSEPELTRLLNTEEKKLRGEKVKQLPKYTYPDHVITAATLQHLARHGVDFKVHRTDCVLIDALDAQRKEKKGIFGTGLLLSERAAAERAAAERAAAISWELSERERQIIAGLG